MSSARVAELGAVEGLISTTFPCIVVLGKGRPPLPPMTGGDGSAVLGVHRAVTMLHRHVSQSANQTGDGSADA